MDIADKLPCQGDARKKRHVATIYIPPIYSPQIDIVTNIAAIPIQQPGLHINSINPSTQKVLPKHPITRYDQPVWVCGNPLAVLWMGNHVRRDRSRSEMPGTYEDPAPPNSDVDLPLVLVWCFGRPRGGFSPNYRFSTFFFNCHPFRP